jgi:hypothetical protein
VLDPGAPGGANRSGDYDAIGMTRSANARAAGVAYLLYIGVAFPSMLISGRATAGGNMAARLESMARHAGDVRLAAVLGLMGCMCALVLAVTLHAVTRDEDRDVAMLGLTCRVAEGILGAVGIPATFALLVLVSGPNAASLEGTQAVGTLVLRHTSTVAAWFFAIGSTAFSWLLLRGRMIPLPLAWLGVGASALLVVTLPLQMGALLSGQLVTLMWLPMAAFEIPLGVWFVAKGVRPLRGGSGAGQGGARAP